MEGSGRSGRGGGKQLHATNISLSKDRGKECQGDRHCRRTARKQQPADGTVCAKGRSRPRPARGTVHRRSIPGGSRKILHLGSSTGWQLRAAAEFAGFTPADPLGHRRKGLLWSRPLPSCSAVTGPPRSHGPSPTAQKSKLLLCSNSNNSIFTCF